MTSSADTRLLEDFLAFTLAGERPAASSGTAPSGVRWTWQGEGVLLLEPARAPTSSVLASAGVHGDETAPIEMLSRLVADIGNGRAPLAARVLVILGNIRAMRAGDRYIDDDLNRLFSGRHTSLRDSREAPRAAELENAALRFFDDAAHPKWHIDMHTAIRASVFEQFALLPHTGEPLARAMFDWLRDARLQAVLLHREKGNTFTHFTAQAAGALACTLELGKVRPFGQNDLARFAASDAALRRLIAGEPAAESAPLRVFTVVAQIDKHSEHFILNVASDVPNFTAFPAGTELARDGDYRYRVSHDEERIVFPNPKVKPGLRAGLMVVDTTDATLESLG
ncbi:succinylglutamate desuccinylase [Caballeronia ptereochthonis]|uniref:Succinylglutamate desuccinylase n=1 Tax=Caballeronia ptereochthonis TaxID=1777144 RepID=A0A158A7V2_9BURK|nr:succinylglutamate desuccinylase [Caballeronia ptereochthonis]SAK53167.1 succinylglutamate desuccinylase [Caballeronia ptereochthonis]